MTFHTSHHRPATAAAAPPTRVSKPRPRIRLGVETFIQGGDYGDFDEITIPVVELTFEYGSRVVRASDQVDPPEFAGRGPRRNREAEKEAGCLLEKFGAVELSCIPHFEPSLDSRADYVLSPDHNIHAYCSFSAHALPKLRTLGWMVDIAPNYPYQIAQTTAGTPDSDGWYASVNQDEDGKGGWFSFELGVSVKGQTAINLLPALLDILDRCPDQTRLDALLRIPSRCIAVPAGDNLYVPMAPEQLRRVLNVLRDLYQGGNSLDEDGNLMLSRHDAGRLSELDFAFGGEPQDGARGNIVWSGQAEELHEKVSLFDGPRSRRAPKLMGLQATLRPYQREGLEWLQHLREVEAPGILADDMGLGKTLQTIAHLLAEKEAGRLNTPALVVAPTSLVRNWEREVKKFAPQLSTLILHGPRRRQREHLIEQNDIVITTYNLLHRDAEVFDQHDYSVLILDEAQAIKNSRSQAHKATRAIRADQRLALTGTPLENNLGELHSLFDFLEPGLLGSRSQFTGYYRVPIEGGDEERLEQLRRRVRPFILRRLKSEVAKDLPSKTELMRPVEFQKDQRELYESIRVAAHADVRKVIRKKGLAASTIPVLDALMKLRQVCCDPRLVKMAAAREVKASAKYELLMDMVRQQVRTGHSILVFSQFTSMLSLISEGLLSEGIRHLTLSGKTKDRQARVDAFQAGKADVFLISLKAGGTGLTLTRADTVIHYDPWWNPAAQAQATDRAYRIGQQRPVFVHNLIVAGSVEERMMQLQQKKKHLADALLAGPAAPAALSELDVEELFAPLDLI